MARMVQCIKLNKEGEGMDFAPLPGDLGKKIWNQVSVELNNGHVWRIVNQSLG